MWFAHFSGIPNALHKLLKIYCEKVKWRCSVVLIWFTQSFCLSSHLREASNPFFTLSCWCWIPLTRLSGKEQLKAAAVISESYNLIISSWPSAHQGSLDSPPQFLVLHLQLFPRAFKTTVGSFLSFLLVKVKEREWENIICEAYSENDRMSKDGYKTSILKAKQSLKVHTFASNTERLMSKHCLTSTFTPCSISHLSGQVGKRTGLKLCNQWRSVWGGNEEQQEKRLNMPSGPDPFSHLPP